MIKVKGFIEFVRSQGVIGLAVGFILGGAVSKVVSSLVSDIINPLLGIVLGAAGNLTEYNIEIGGAKIMWGNFVNTAVDFVVIAAVVYFFVKFAKLDELDLKKAKLVVKKAKK
ncbi:MAG: MscL family protein [Patescibacteria group bacterium]|nr:MscL family protein [Patescibacteria group bacterium]